MEKNIRRFYLYRIVSRFYFYLPVLTIIFLKINFNYLQVGILLAIYGITICALQIPSGIIADRYGQKNSIGLGELTKASGLVLLYMSDDFYTLIVAQMLCGLGYVLASGTDSAFLYAVFADLKRTDEYLGHEAKSASYMFLSVFLAGVIGAIVTNYFLKLSLLLTIPTTLMAATIAFSLKEPTSRAEKKRRADLRTLFQYISHEKHSLVLYMLFYATIRGLILSTFVAFIPITLFIESQVSLLYFGLILGSFTIVSFTAARHYTKIIEKLGTKATTGLMFLTLFLAVSILVFSRIRFAVGVPALLGLSAGLIRPFAIGNINAICQQPQIRASVISFAEFLYGTINVLFLLVVSSVLYFYGLDAGFTALGVIFTAISLSLLSFWGILRIKELV